MDTFNDVANNEEKASHRERKNETLIESVEESKEEEKGMEMLRELGDDSQ